MHKLRLIVSLVVVFSFLHLSLCFGYYVKISPTNEQNYYEMKIGDTITFKAEGLGWDNINKVMINNADLFEVVWEFDSNVLEEIERAQDTITLKAIRKKITTLKVKAKVQEHPVEEKIGVVIR